LKKSTYRTIIKLKTPEFYDLDMTCRAHGWKSLAPFSWDADDNTLRFAVLTGEGPVDLRVKQKGSNIEAAVFSSGKLETTSKKRLKLEIKRSLGLDVDTTGLLAKAKKAGPEYGRLVRKGAGRILRAPTLWEDMAKTLFTTNCTWALTVKICSELCSDTFVDPAPSGIYPFPSFEKVNSFTHGMIRKLVPVGYRAPYFKLLAERFCHDPALGDIESAKSDTIRVRKIISGLKGFGPYACAHVQVLTGRFQDIPVDTVVTSYLKKVHRVRKPEAYIKRKYKAWGEYKWWGLRLEQIIMRKHWLGD